MKIVLAVPLFVIFIYIVYLRAKVREFDSIYVDMLKYLKSINNRIKADDERITELYTRIECLELITLEPTISKNDD